MLTSDDHTLMTFDMPLVFATLGEEQVELFVKTVEVSTEVVLNAEVTMATWTRVDESGSFHVDGQREPSGWDDDRAVRLVLRLRRPFARRYDAVETFLVDFGDESTPVRNTEAWVALEYTQEFAVPDTDGATTEVGVRTSWAEQ